MTESATLVESLKKTLQANGELLLKVKVIPKSARSEIAGYMADGSLKVKVAAVPEKGRANAELCGYLARALGVTLRQVVIRSGETSPHKQVRISRG